MATSKEVESAKADYLEAAERIHDDAYSLDSYIDLDSKLDLDDVPELVDRMRNDLQVVLMSAHFLRQELDK